MGKKVYTIYLHLFPNGKMYIGVTRTDVNTRWQNGNGYNTQILMSRAINKHGWDNIEHIIIAENLTKKEACQLEIDLIKYWNTNNSDNGYNLSIGGEGGNTGVTCTEETRKKMSKVRTGKKHTKETKRKMSERALNMSKEHRLKLSEKAKGRTFSEETKKKMGVANIGRKMSEETKAKIKATKTNNRLLKTRGKYEI